MTKKRDSDVHQEYVDRVLSNTQQFLEETLRENERLRALTLQLENERLRNVEQLFELKEAIARLELQQVRQQQQVSEFEAENRRFFTEYAEIEQQNSNLANLYVASYRLHGSLDHAEVLQVMNEIIINLIGSEELAIFELEPDARTLRLVSSFGIDPARWSTVSIDDSPIGRTVQSGEMFVHEPPHSNVSAPESSLTACIPLKVEERVIGVIAVFRMLPQKPELVATDRELFSLLGSQAAMAFYCSKLHAKVRIDA